MTTETDKKSGLSRKQTSWIIVGAVLVLLAVVGGAGSLWMASMNKAAQSSDNQQSQQLAQTGGDDQRFDPQTTPTPTPTQSATPSNTKLEEDRAKLESYLLSPFDPETVQNGPQFFNLEVGQGKKAQLQITYSNVGDQDMAAGYVYVKLAPGLRLVPGTIQDTFNGKEAVTLADALYNSETNVIEFGPGTTDKNRSAVKAGEGGTLTFQVEVAQDAEVGSELRVYSYITEESGNQGKIDVAFIKVV